MNPATVRPPFDLTGQAALITGGATGLGFGMARCLMATGAWVVLLGRREVELQRACSQLGPRAVALAGDVTRLETTPSLVEEAERLAGALSLMVNNAGVHLKRPALETSDADFESVVRTHVFGAFALTREVGRRMVSRREGCILFIASDKFEGALLGDPDQRTRILGRRPLGRFGEPEDVGWAAVCLALAGARFINGVVLPVDGGASVGF